MNDDDSAAGSADERAYPAFDRRRGPRRLTALDPSVPFERRQAGDRRKKKPGLAALFGTLMAEDEPTLDNAQPTTAEPDLQP